MQLNDLRLSVDISIRRDLLTDFPVLQKCLLAWLWDWRFSDIS
jgi:hypothetical protein